MNLKLHALEDRERALELVPRLDRYAAEGMAEFRDDPLPERTGERFLERHWDAPETLFLLAEDSATGTILGLCLIGPLEDPLTGERTPLIAILHVDPDLRHRGIARALVGEARRLLARRGFHKLAARAGHNDDALISMGERWGFVRHWELMLLE